MMWPRIERGPEDGAPVILLHGMPGTSSDLAPLGERLSSRYRTVCPDFPGFGENPAPPRGDPSLRGRADALMTFADSLGMRSFALVAHSMGGATAMTAAAAYPDRVRALVLLASVGLRRHRAMTPSPELLRILLPAVRPFAPLRRLAWLATRAAYRRQRLTKEDSLTVAQAIWQLQLFAQTDFRALRASAAAIRCPTLVVYAEDDRLVEPSISKELSSALVGARCKVLKAGGHRLPQKCSALIADAVLETLERGDSAGEGARA